MKIFAKLNNRGFEHVMVLVAFVVIFGIGGVAYLVKSNAQVPPASINTPGVQTVAISRAQCAELGGTIVDDKPGYKPRCVVPISTASTASMTAARCVELGGQIIGNECFIYIDD